MPATTAAKPSARPYKVVVWGATGFTGRLVCEHLAKDYAGQFKWAMAGRNKQKIESVRSELAKQAPTVDQIEVVTADANDKQSLETMAAATEVVISLVGPYARYGKPLVEACVSKGTHYCDLTGEPQFIQWAIQSQHDAAARSGTRIVHCCGFDSVPTELTTLLAVHELAKHHAAAARGEFLLVSAMGGFSGGTIESIIGLFQEPDSVRKPALHPYALDPAVAGKPLSECTDQGLSLGIKKSRFDDGWTAPFLGAAIDEPVVRRSNALLRYGPDFSYTERTQAGGILKATLITFFLGAFGLFLPLAARFPLLRKLLPAPSQGPSRKTMEGGHFHVQTTVEGTDSSGTAVRTRAYMKDPHRDPGYLSTSRLILECALCLCLQGDDVAADPWAGKVAGGVLTPASAFGLVLAERCKAAGYKLDAKTLAGAKKVA